MKTYFYMGREHRVFAFRAFGQEHEAIILEESYASNGTLALQVMEIAGEGPDRWIEPWGMLTVNVEDDCVIHQSDCEAFVKNYSENEGWAVEIAAMIGEEEGIWAELPHGEVPLYAFDLEKI